MFVGIDACGGGWVVVQAEGFSPMHLHTAAVCKTFPDAISGLPPGSSVAVDIPIGLIENGFRGCDLLAREIMGRFKCRVFKTSPRAAIMAATKTERHRLHRELTGEGLSPVAAAFAPKVAEANIWMLEKIRKGRAIQDRVFEVHPELYFRALNGGQAVAKSKHSAAGLCQRYSLLQPHFRGQDVDAWVRNWLRGRPRTSVKEDDVVDALVACLTAATWTPESTIGGSETSRDSMGFRMEMRCPASPP